MVCGSCSKEIPEGSAFCNQCGTPTKPPVAGPAPAQAASRPVAAASPADAPETEMWSATPSLRAAILPTVGVFVAIVVVEVAIRFLFKPSHFVNWWWWAYVAVLLIYLGYAWLRQISVHYRLTSKYLYVERGLLSRETEVLDLRRVRDFDMSQPFMSRLVGLGQIVIQSSDRSTQRFVLRDLDRPQIVLSYIQQAVEKRRPTMLDIE